MLRNGRLVLGKEFSVHLQKIVCKCGNANSVADYEYLLLSFKVDIFHTLMHVSKSTGILESTFASVFERPEARCIKK